MGVWNFLDMNTNTNKGAGTYQGLVRGDGAFNTFGSGTANAPAKTLNRKNTILGMSPDKFSQLFGSMGQAIAPNTPMGRLGGIAAGMATRNIERERKAPGLALERRSKLLDIKQKKKDLEETKPLTDWELYEKDPEAYKQFKTAGRAEGFNKYQSQIEAFKSANPDASNWDAMTAIANMRGKAKDGFNVSQMAAIKNIQERIAAGADLDEVNYIAEQAGIGQFELTPTGEMEIVPGTGFMGFFQDKVPTMKITPVREGESPKNINKLQRFNIGGKNYLYDSVSKKYYDKEMKNVVSFSPPEAKTKKKRGLSKYENAQHDSWLNKPFEKSLLGKLERTVKNAPEFFRATQEANKEAYEKLKNKKRYSGIPSLSTFKRNN